MANCLIALGSNLGDRGAQLERAVAKLAELPNTRLISRSQWLETTPIGGPKGQGPFLNGAVRIDAAIDAPTLHRCLMQIEAAAGRQRRERWAARTLDLDLLLCGGLVLNTPELQIPHPRMTFRRFVLTGAAAAAPWMRHPGCGWTVERLLHHLDTADDVVMIATANNSRGTRLADALNAQLDRWTSDRRPTIEVLDPRDPRLGQSKLTLILDRETGNGGGPDPRQSDKLNLRIRCGPAAEIVTSDDGDALAEAAAAVAAVWTNLISD